MRSFLEALDEANQELRGYQSTDDVMNQSVESNDSVADNKAALEELNRLYTPVLVRRKIEQNIATDTKLELAESGEFQERTTIQFDKTANYDQLVAVAARILQRQKNSDNWQAYIKASQAKKQADINMQQEESGAAPALAKEWLIQVSKSNNSPSARDAAIELLGGSNG